MLFSFALLTLASAHVRLYSPNPRDNSANRSINSLTGPCGAGYSNSGSRTTVALTGSTLFMRVGDADATVVVNGAVGENPQTFGTQLSTQSASLQNVTVPLDLTKLGAKAGDKLTVQIVETAGDGTKFVCADLEVEKASSGSGSSTGSTVVSGAKTAMSGVAASIFVFML